MKKGLKIILIVSSILLFLILLLIFTSLLSPSKYPKSYDTIITTPDSNFESMDTSGENFSSISLNQSLYNTEEGSKIRKQGSVSISVTNIDSAIEDLDTINTQYSGKITNIYDSGRGNDRIVNITIQVPVESFEKYYNALREMNGEVTYANIGSTDLTKEYIDITSQLKNLRNVEAQLTNILQRATTIQDILSVQKELNTVRGEIELYEAQERHFNNQTDYSHITVTFSIDKKGLEISDTPWSPVGELRAALSTLVVFLKGVINVGIWIVVFSPVVIIPVVIVRYVSKKRKERKV